MKNLIKIALLVLFLGTSIYANNVATVTGLNGKASVQRDAGELDLNLGDKLQEKDVIHTKDKTKVQIIFKDETIITIGKNSTFAINEYLFDDNKEPVAKFGMLKGAMRAITGKIGKVAPDKFSVKTKTATMGIRGTNFSILVGEDGSYNAYCTFGAISVSIDGAEHVVQQGFFISISPDGKVEIKEFSPQDLKEMKEKNFAKAESKKGKASGDEIASNEGQLDVTVEEMDNIVIKDISDSVVDAEQTGEESSDLTLTDNAILAGYTQADALYEGTFAGTSTHNFDTAGFASLYVNFGQDTASLYLEGNNEVSTSYDNFSGVGTNTITGGQEYGSHGVADGKFYGDTGNVVNGNYTVTDGQGTTTASGTYSVESSNLTGSTQPY
nr:FecR family protein [uncultured Sulfurimonas sp.]